jgi:chromosome segregation ATPase
MSLDKLKNKLKGLEAKLDKAIDSENYESAADIREEIEKVKEKIKKAEDKNDLEEQFDEIKEKHSDFTPDVFFPGNELP